MPAGKILISGAGIAGSTLAYWLAKYDFQVVVIERSPAEQKAGQGIDIEAEGLKIVKMMGSLLDNIMAKTTGEEGFALVDEQSRCYATFAASDALSPTKSIEIMRGDLTEILYRAADEFANVTYRYRTTIQSLRQTPENVIVDLEDKNSRTVKTEEFDFVVGADGVSSRTRKLVMGSPEQLNCLKPIGCFSAYFSIPAEEQDWPYSRLCQFTDRRTICIRPRGKESKESSVYLIHVTDDKPSSLVRARNAGDRQMQKEALAELYIGLGWEIPRVIEQMLKAENFYFDDLRQVKLQKWSQGRVVLVGDAAWAPTPLTGQGNNLAVLGAYVLAQEMSRNRDDGVAAFRKYEKRLRAYVENRQKIFLGGYAPKLVNLQTSWGIWLFRRIAQQVAWVIKFVLWTGIWYILPGSKEELFNLEVEDKE